MKLAGLMSSFCFDYLVRFRGATSLKYGVLNSVPAPTSDNVRGLVEPVEKLVMRELVDYWEIGQVRARIDALVARAYGLDVREYAAVLSSFPLLDKVQPMLPGEPKSFVTRDLALLLFAAEVGEQPPDIVDLLESAGIELPHPHKDFRRLDARVDHHRKIGAIPYRPTPKGGRPPTDPALLEAVLGVLNDEPQTAETIAEVVEEEGKVVKKVLESLVKAGECFAQGRGSTRSYYVIEE